MQLVSCLLLSIVVAVHADSLNFNDCGSEYPLESVEIEGCEEIPCPFYLETYVNVTMKFIPKFPVQSLTHLVTVVVLNIPEPVDATPLNPCSLMDCKNENEEEQTFNGQIYLPIELPPVPALLRWKMFSESKQEIICMETELELYEPEYFKN